MDDPTRAPGAELPGGYIKAVVRVGDTVRRKPDANAEFVHKLLKHLESAGFWAAPRFLGIDEEGREILSYLEGHVAWDSFQPSGIWSEESLKEVAKLTRHFHDTTAGTHLAGTFPVVCHNDLSPRNTVYRDVGEGFRPVAFIDWDDARPGYREDDLADVFWHFLFRCPEHPSTEFHVSRMHQMLDAYGYEGDRAQFVSRILKRMINASGGIQQRADAGEPVYQRLIALGALDYIRVDLEWLSACRQIIEDGLSRSDT